jgi:hypothetical protein
MVSSIYDEPAVTGSTHDRIIQCAHEIKYHVNTLLASMEQSGMPTIPDNVWNPGPGLLESMRTNVNSYIAELDAHKRRHDN